MHHCTPAIHRAPLPFCVTCTRHSLQAYTHMSQFTIWWSGNNDLAHTGNPKRYNNNSWICHTIKWCNPDDYGWNRLEQNNKINKAPTTCMFPHLLGSHLLHVSIPDHHPMSLIRFSLWLHTRVGTFNTYMIRLCTFYDACIRILSGLIQIDIAFSNKASSESSGTHYKVRSGHNTANLFRTPKYNRHAMCKNERAPITIIARKYNICLYHNYTYNVKGYSFLV